jgi:hypothetical protein
VKTAQEWRELLDTRCISINGMYFEQILHDFEELEDKLAHETSIHLHCMKQLGTDIELLKVEYHALGEGHMLVESRLRNQLAELERENTVLQTLVHSAEKALNAHEDKFAAIRKVVR